MTTAIKNEIDVILKGELQKKFENFLLARSFRQANYVPILLRTLGKDPDVVKEFVKLLYLAFGTSIFEPVAVTLAKPNFARVERQYVVGSEIFADCQAAIQKIINDLTISRKPDKARELEILHKSLGGAKNKLKPILVDLFVENSDGEKWLFDLKTAKPNKGDFQKFKQTLLEWAGIEMTKNANAKINTCIAIPYNPYHPAPYQFWTLAGMLDLEKELFVAEKFWNFLGGDGAFEDLLGCFERVGVAMRGEIDGYFARFRCGKVGRKMI